MWTSLKMNWVLQSQKIPTNLTIDTPYKAKRDGVRMFPLTTPIDLIDRERNAIAKISIQKIVITESSTTVHYIVLKIYTEAEREVLTNYWKENI